ncbi:YesL family protein [Micromonospora sp. CPCC 206061]|uniref:YesL family protein n=1 Tax=Micromonospora sp. CPCC 206061 TaxID=3122410 RepID=UPI002FF42AAB
MQRRVPPTIFAPPGAKTSPNWAIKLYEAADEVAWAAKLNLLWILFTLMGGVLLGVGPATVAAYTLARRRAMGESFRSWPAFVSVYRREFTRGSVLVLPLVAAAALLVTNYFYFASLGSAGSISQVATVVALGILVVIAAYALPMSVHYDLRTPHLLPKASLFALTRPAASVLLLFVFTAVVYVATTFPFLVLVLAIGGWIQLDTWLCLRFFAENEAKLHAKGTS